jgi:UPF0755 protein
MAKKTKKKIIYIISALMALGMIVGYYYYNKIWTDNVVDNKEGFHYIYIKTGSTFEELCTSLQEEEVLHSVDNFIWVANLKGYSKKVKPGRYKITQNMSNSDIVNMLRIGKQDPVKLEFNSIRTVGQLAGAIGHQLEVDSTEFLSIFEDKAFLKTKGFTTENAISVFIPNTYSVNWNINAKALFERMCKEYDKFWTPSRKALAKEIKLSPTEVSTLASIVEQESSKNDEKPTVAGVYINRLNVNMALEADPTLIFAAGDFSIRRVLNIHKEIDSPYNTYKYKGLPPGPICVPSPSSIDAVLNYKRHDYIYFCAKETLDGYHNFAVSYKEHLANAKRYQAALDRMKIKK